MRLVEHSTIRFQLTSLVIACVLPVWLLAGILVFQQYRTKVHQMNKDMQEKADAITHIVDRQFSSVQAALEALATSPSFSSADFRDVHRQALQLLGSYPGADIIVADATGQQVVNSFRPYGTPLPRRNNPAIVRQIFDSGRPSTSNLFFGAVTRRPLIAIDVPVFIGGKVAYDLSMTFSSDVLGAILSHQQLPKGWDCSIMDRYRIVVASSRDPGASVGKEIAPDLRKAMAGARQGTTEGVNAEGSAVFVTFSESPMSGWSAAVEVPKAVVMTEIYRWMVWAIGSATLISLIGVLLAIRIGRRIALSIRSLVPPALSIGRGEAVTSIGYQVVKETAEVGSALLQASALLQEHEETALRYTHRLIEMEEELRKRIATELHDDIGQALTVLALNLSHVSSSLPPEVATELRARLTDASMLTKGINRGVRALMTELSPPQIEEYGLAAAVRSYAEQYTSRTGIAVEVYGEEDAPRLTLQQEVALFRIAQEALLNVAKHAEATEVEVFLMNEETSFQLVISDNGKGFLPQQPSNEAAPSGWGLTIMRERAEGIGGSFSLESAPSAGTTVSVVLDQVVEDAA